MKKLLMTTAILAAFTVFQPSLAHEGEDHDAAPAVAAPVQAMPAAQALNELQTGFTTIDDLAASGKDGLHEEIEKLEKGPVASLLADNSISANKKTRLTASLKQLTAQFGKLHDAADKKNTAQIAIELKKAHGALKLVEAVLK